MALDRTNTPSPDGGNEKSDTLTAGERWAADLLDTVAQMVADDEIEPCNAAVLRGKAAFGARRNAIAINAAEVDIWGYGTCRALFKDAESDKAWIRVDEFTGPSGCSFDTLLDEMHTEIVECDNGEPEVDVLTWTRPDGHEVEIPLCTINFAFQVMAGRSPWAAEFRKAVFGTFRRAALMTGLADKLGITEIIASDGSVPTADEAREAAFRGPAGAL